MTHEELIKKILQLPLEKQVELLEAISRNVHEQMRPREQRESAVSRLRGIAKFDGTPPTDEELREDYIRYLTEKYS